MAFNLRNYVKNYFKRKKAFSIVTDFLFIAFIVLLIIPGTRKEVSSYLIRMISLPPSELSSDNQFMINEQSWNWQFHDLNGNTVSLASLNDKPIFLNFWATWCPPCIGELPGIADLYEDYKDKIHFVLVSNEDAEKINDFAGKHSYENLPFYIYRATPADFATQSIPATFLLSKEGKVVISKKGAARWNSGKMKKIIDGLLQE